MHRANLVFLVLLLLLVGRWVPDAGADTWDPTHPLWNSPGVAVESFLRAHADAQTRRPALWKSSAAAAKQLTRVGQRVLVIPVLLADGGAAPVSRDELQRQFFGPGEATVRGYWDTVSGGELALEGLVLPWVRLPEGLSFYRNVLDQSFVSGAGPRAMARDALRLAADVHNDLRRFDSDGPDGIAGSGDDDGILDLVLILHPEVGFEVDPEQSGPALLSVQDRLEPDPQLEESGVRADAFAMLSARGPLGVWVHEFGHLLGLEDLYDLGVSGAFSQLPSRGGLGLWSLMASGTWGDEGRRPSHLDPVSRRLLGFENREIVRGFADTAVATVTPQQRESVAVLPFGAWGRERFVIERRAPRPGAVVDGALPGEGVLIYRVDEALRENDRNSGFWIELLQADGQSDLQNLVNNGDAGDPFDGIEDARFAADTNPSSQSRLPDPSRVPPSVVIEPVDGEGRQALDVALSEDPTLRLAAAYFESGSDRKTYLSLESTETWLLRFDEVGRESATSARVTVESLDPRVEVLAPATVDLQRQGLRWSPASDVVVRDLGGADLSTSIPMRLTVEIDGDAASPRSIDLPLPVGRFPGLTRIALDEFVPAVVSAGRDTTRFRRLGITELPLPTESGWGLFTGGEASYADSVEVSLTGSGFAPTPERRLYFWSRHDTEPSLPGQAFDGGVIEAWIPDQGWRVLEASGGPTAHIVQRSLAATRGETGFGGDAVPWTAYEVDLPDVDLPLRLRFRFASDGSISGGGWSIAGLETGIGAASAEVSVRIDADGRVNGSAVLDGDYTRIASLRFRYRVPPSQEWQVASSLFTAPSSDTVLRELELPRDESVFRIGLFAEVSGGGTGSTPPLLLGEAGYRRYAEFNLPAVHPNPTGLPVVFEWETRDEAQQLLVYDLRGRRVRSLVLPAFTSRREWSGDDDDGTPLAAGVYFYLIQGREEFRGRIVLLP